MCRVSTFWSDDLYNLFVKKAMLNTQEAKIMEMLIKKCTLQEIADDPEVRMSISTVSRRINMMRGKYDNLVHLYPNIFPQRTNTQIYPENRTVNLYNDKSKNTI